MSNGVVGSDNTVFASGPDPFLTLECDSENVARRAGDLDGRNLWIGADDGAFLFTRFYSEPRVIVAILQALTQQRRHPAPILQLFLLRGQI